MFNLSWGVKIGDFKLGMLDSVKITKSVEMLSDTAEVVLPAVCMNVALDVESKIKRGDKVVIELGYDGELVKEFEGYVESIRSDDDNLTIMCEDAIWLFKVPIKDKEYVNVDVKALLSDICSQVAGSLSVDCSYSFKYDKFVAQGTTGYDVLKKIQEEAKPNIYMKDNVLYVNPSYSEITNDKAVIYDFSVNIESSSLEYKRSDERKILVEIESTDKEGKVVKIEEGVAGGDRISLKMSGITDVESLKNLAKQELLARSYEGYEGSFTGWLVPVVEPCYKIELRDSDYEYKKGVYYVVATKVEFDSGGGKRELTIGKKIG